MARRKVSFIYFAPSDMQVPRVERQMQAALCSALVRQGAGVELLAIRIRTLPTEPKAEDPLDFYRVRTRFRLTLVPVPVSQHSREWWIGVNRLLALSLVGFRRLVAQNADEATVLYVKNYALAAALWLMKRVLRRASALVVWEAHVPPGSIWQIFVLRRADRIVANTYALAKDLETLGFQSLAVHQGVDLELAPHAAREDARKQLGLDTRGPFVVYTGKITTGYEEVRHIVDAAKLLPDVNFLFVGGRADHVESWRQQTGACRLSNVHFVGFVPPAEIGAYQAAADVLVSYYSTKGQGAHLNRYRSPGKLFEYMAAGRPIVAADMPVLREVLGDPPAALLVPPDTPAELANGIRRLLEDAPLANRLARRAKSAVEAFTWDARAKKMLDYFEVAHP